jgi:predicted outer membrane repeat protein
MKKGTIFQWVITILGCVFGGVLGYWYSSSSSVDYDGINWVVIKDVHVSDIKFTNLTYNEEYKEMVIRVECDITNDGEPILPTKQGDLSRVSFSPIFHLKNIGGLEGNNKEFKSYSFRMFQDSKEIRFSNDVTFLSGSSIHCVGTISLSPEDFKKYILDDYIDYIPELYVKFLGYTLTEYQDTPETDEETFRVIKQDSYTSTIKEDVKNLHSKLNK